MNIEKLESAKKIIVSMTEAGKSAALSEVLDACKASKVFSMSAKALAELTKDGCIVVVDGIITGCKVSSDADAILENLRFYGECCSEHADGTVWTTVYLPNAMPSDISAHQFAGYLSALEARGLYKKIDGDFGDVRIS